MKKNILIDGLNLAFRQYFAFGNNLSTSTGNPSGIVLGFIKSLLKLKKDFPDASLYIVWDGSSKKRKEIFPEYKANRNKSEKNIVFQQVEALQKILLTLPVNQIKGKDEEADDLIASLCFSNLKDSLNYIYSTDKDFFQIVIDGKIIVLYPKEGDYIAYDEEKVKEKMGVSPDQIIDFRAIDGDASDNIPRCPKIEKKIINFCIEKYGSIENLYQSNFYGLKVQDYKKLKQFKNQFFINKKLITLNKEIEISESEILQGGFNQEEFEKYLQEFEIFSIDIMEVSKIFNTKPPMFKSGVNRVSI